MLQATLHTKSAFEAVKKAIQFVSDDTLRPTLTGVYFEFTPNSCTVTATNAHTLYSCTVDALTTCDTFNVILPVKELRAALKGTSFHVTHTPEATHVNGVPMTPIDARFPAYRDVIPQKVEYWHDFNRADLCNTVTGMAYFCDKGTQGQRPAVFNFTADKICRIFPHRSVHGAYGAASIPCDGPVKPAYDILICADLLSRTLKALNSEHVRMQLTGENKGVLIGTGRDGETVLVMTCLSERKYQFNGDNIRSFLGL